MADILLYGISFCKKRCKAVVEELKKELKMFELLLDPCINLKKVVEY